MKKTLFIILLGAFWATAIATPAFAATSVSFTPVNVSVSQGQTFTLTIGVNPQGVKNYIAKMELLYPASLLEVKSFTFANDWIQLSQSGYDLIDNVDGLLIKTAGYPGGVSTPITFGTVSFLAKKSGDETIALNSNSFALDENSQNVLAGASVQTTIAIRPIVPPSTEQSPQINTILSNESPEQISAAGASSASSSQSSPVSESPSSTEPQVLSTANIFSDAKIITNQIIEQALVIGGQIVETAIKIKEISDNPEVEKVTKQVIAPVTVGVSVAVLTPSFASVALPLSKYLFLQPLLFLGIRKRKNWGKVYNSLDKLPLGLAILRLIDVKTNKLVQTRVTDQEGNYGFFVVKPGEYRIEVVKNDFVFPSKFLADDDVDGRMIDIYHGQNIVMDKENVNIIVNIPIDPSEQKKTPAGFILKKNILIAQNIFSMSGTFLMLIYLLISNTWYIWLFLILHISIYLLFLKFIAPKKLKGWGTVYDIDDKNPLYKTIVRLFAKKDNKLINFNVTDKKGRYAFLVGPSDYFVTFEREGYNGSQGKELNLTDAKEEKILIKEDAGLRKSRD